MMDSERRTWLSTAASATLLAGSLVVLYKSAGGDFRSMQDLPLVFALIVILSVGVTTPRAPRQSGISLAALLILFAVAASPAGAACGDAIFAENFERGDTSGWTVWRPAPGTTWQWQLSGTIDISFDVGVYDVDLFDTPQATLDALHALGRRVICYFSAGSWEEWRADASAFPAVVLGDSLDPPFTDEKWLDIRRIDLLGPIMEARLDLALAKGCDAVEPDNVDGFDNPSGFPLSAADQLTYNRYLAAEAHERQLSVGLKNDLAQIGDLVDEFDWAINEQCWEFDECDGLLPFIAQGKAVFGVEYSGDPRSYCPALNARCYSWLHKNIDLDAERLDCQDLAPP